MNKVQRTYKELKEKQKKLDEEKNPHCMGCLVDEIDNLEIDLLEAVAEHTKDINPNMKKDVQSGMIKMSTSMMRWIEKQFI